MELDSLVLDPQNARTHNKKNQEAVRASISEFGQVEVLVVQKGSNVVIGGNCRLKEMRRLGHKEAWVAEVDVDDTKAKRLALALNRTGELAGWDDKVLGKLLVDLESAGDMDNLGWNDVELDKILSDVETGWLDELDQDAPLPEGSVFSSDTDAHPECEGRSRGVNGKMDHAEGKRNNYKLFQFGKMNCMIPIDVYETIHTFLMSDDEDSLQESLMALFERGMAGE
jgi:hypothetical protein